MADILKQGPYLAGAGANIAGASNDWSNPGNITADDGSTATVTFPADVLAASSFGFTLPTDREIAVTGIVVELDEPVTSSGALFVALSKDSGATAAGTGKSLGNLQAPNWASSGNPNDLWGTTWTAAEINAAAFAVRLTLQVSGTGAIDAVRVTVYYTQVEFRPETFQPVRI